MRREGCRVLLDISEDAWGFVLLAIGFCAADANGEESRRFWFYIANELNEGNPQWTPYKLPPVPPLPVIIEDSP